MPNSLFTFLTQPNTLWVLTGALMLGFSAGVLGCFAFLKRRALIGDTLAHAALPGVTSAFLLTGSRSPVVVIVGAMTSGFIGLWTVELLRRHTKIKEDSALAIVLSFFFAVGVFQLTIIQKIPTAAQAGLDKILFGQAASLVPDDLAVLSVLSALILVSTIIFFDRFRMIIFDPNYARVAGINIGAYEKLLALLVMLAVVIGIQLVGIVLVAALMITPAAAARYWTNRLSIMLTLAGLCGSLAGIFGALISTLAPRMPTGPWMVVAVTILFVVSAMFAPERGMSARYIRRLRTARRIAAENIVRTLFKLDESNPQGAAAQAQLLHFRQFDFSKLERILSRLERKGFITRSGEQVTLTELGLEMGRKITRRHRLWELYLTKNTAISSDHAHFDAEEIEHMLTPELEAQLLRELEYPSHDPHGKEIPG